MFSFMTTVIFMTIVAACGVMTGFIPFFLADYLAVLNCNYLIKWGATKVLRYSCSIICDYRYLHFA